MNNEDDVCGKKILKKQKRGEGINSFAMVRRAGSWLGWLGGVGSCWRWDRIGVCEVTGELWVVLCGLWIVLG